MRLFISFLSMLAFSAFLSWFSSLSIFLYALVILPGTTLHELMHWLSAFLLGGAPQSFSILPKLFASNGSHTLGEVAFIPNAWNAAFISLAPLSLFPLCWFLIQCIARPIHAWKRFLLLYLAACLWLSALPSSTDVRIAFSHPLSLACFVCLLLGLTFLYCHVKKARQAS
jgi:hypothetical protein